MDFIKQLYYKYRNFILYGIIGGFCATLDFVIYSGLCYVNMNHLWANIISTHCGIFCSFLLNRSYNFKVKDKTGLRFLSFYIIGLIGLALSEGLLEIASVSTTSATKRVCVLKSIVCLTFPENTPLINFGRYSIPFCVRQFVRTHP